jgi:hypothetical protein
VNAILLTWLAFACGLGLGVAAVILWQRSIRKLD